ncbi:hypothetical protein DSOL_4820 [Desulfosporosinus metallidurans]|uniref:Uncharacterized protein n=1 Tax=Desulfosporosinus metallidurans TaxID=1888891 RepID=A0A1Q8QHP8_9FIRM|nr:hypothetical protein DSOL_4820 [Desulfosporosinus metallidurans]
MKQNITAGEAQNLYFTHFSYLVAKMFQSKLNGRHDVIRALKR